MASAVEANSAGPSRRLFVVAATVTVVLDLITKIIA
jgi:hypothetical protein